MLEIRNITKIYRSKTGEQVKALDNVSIQFPETGMVFILGKSGSGKSTLLNVMGGLDSYDEGEFIIKGKSSKDFGGSDFDAYRNTFIGFIFQEYNVLDDFTVGANIGLALELQGKKATDEAVNNILAQVDLLNYAKRKPNELSGGQKQRVAIARALVKDPQIIMADEPTGALDSNTGKQIFDTLKELSKEKLVLIVSHDRDFAEKYADRIVELADGQIIEDVSKHERKAERLSDGMHRVNDHILRIEGGYRLTAKDLDMINAYLAKNDGDVLLSGDNRVNEELRSAVGISKDGASTVFEGTTPERDIKAKAYNKDETNFIRSRLPMKNAVKMGSSGLKHKKFRLFMTILLSFISFAMFGLSSSMAAYNKINAATESIIDSQIRSAAMTLGVRCTTTWEGEKPYTRHDGQGFNAQDIEYLMQETGLEFVPVFTGYSYADKYNNQGGFDVSHLMSNYSTNTVYSGQIAGFVNMSREQIPSDYAIVGELPAQSGEIALTEFMYRQFKQYGFKDAEGNEIKGADLTMLNDGSANDLIGKTININKIGWNNLGEGNDFEFKIVGIINTNFNYDRYTSLMPMDETQQQHQQQGNGKEETSLLDMFLGNEVKYERDFGFHALGFVHADDIEDMIPYMADNSIGGSQNDYNQYMNSPNGGSLGFYIYKPAEVDGDEPTQLLGANYVSASATALSKLKDIVWFSGTAKTELAQNEILLPLSRIDDFVKDVERNLDYTTFETELQAALPDIMTRYNELKQEQLEYNSAGSINCVNVAAQAYGEVNSCTSDDFYATAGAKSAIAKLFGLTGIDNMSTEGVQSLCDLFSCTVTFENAKNYVGQMMMKNFVVENGYHKEDKTDSAFVKWFRTRYNDSIIQPSEWKAKTDAQRLSELTNSSWMLTQDADRYEIDVVDWQRNALKVYLSTSGMELSDITAGFDGYIYKLAENQWTESGETRKEYKTLEGISVVGFFISDNDDHMVVSDLVFDEWRTWYDAKEEELYADMEMDSYTEDRAEHKPGVYAFVVAPIAAGDTAAIQKLVELSYADPESTDILYEMQNAVMYTLGSFNEIIEILAQVFVWVGLGLALFSSFLLMNFISTSISYKKREIGILRAVGARSSDVFKIFFSEAFIIAFINFVLATAASVTAVVMLNNYMRTQGINITLLSFGPAQIALMLGVSVVVAILSSFLPVRSIARRKPVDAIKDR